MTGPDGPPAAPPGRPDAQELRLRVQADEEDRAAGLPLADRLRRRIGREGPLSFAAWMEACLYDPREGYYMRPGRKTGAGPDADFVTPPTLHPFFGSAMGQELHDAWQAQGCPKPFRVLEVGGGEGDLCANALAWMDANAPGLASAIQWLHLEDSPVHRQAQRSRPADGRVRWVGWEAWRTGDPAHAAVLCEVLDAIPFPVWEWSGSAWREARVGWDGGRFVEVLADGQPGPLPPIDPVPGQRVPGQGLAYILLDDVAAGLAAAATVLVADYGDSAARLWTPDRMDGSVRGYRAHQLVDDVLAHPGEVDITGCVDFDLVALALETRGLAPRSAESMERFLLRHGVLDELNRMDRSTLAGASSYLRLRQMLLPTGMGAAFKVVRHDRAPDVTAG